MEGGVRWERSKWKGMRRGVEKGERDN